MKRLTALILLLVFVSALTGCTNRPNKTADIPKLSEISNYTQEQLEEKLFGLSAEEIYNFWGEPNGMLFGLYGDIWLLDKDSNEEWLFENDSSEKIILYYNEDGKVCRILIFRNFD